MENQNINIKEKSSEELGLMLGEIAMSIGQMHQNYLTVAAELKNRMPQVQVSNQSNETKENS